MKNDPCIEIWPEADIGLAPGVYERFVAMARFVAPNTMVIHEGLAKTGHTGKTHGQGLALDWHLEYSEVATGEAAYHITMPLFDQYTVAVRFGWNGIGLYPWWKHPGLHTDMREIAEFAPKALWWRDRKKCYHAIDAESLKELFDA